MKNILKRSLSILLLAVFFSNGAVCAAESRLDKVAKEAKYQTQTAYTGPGSIALLIGNIVKVILSFLGVIFLALLIYGGFLWMTASGNDEQVNKAKKIIKNSVIGIIIIFASYVITSFVVTRLADVGGYNM